MHTGYSPDQLADKPRYAVCKMDESFSLMWNNLSYSLEDTCNPYFPWLRRNKLSVKQLIKPSKGFFPCGSLNAILGPSGAGKTTLLRCLAGRVKKSNVRGKCFVRSSMKTSNIRIGFVPQVDTLFESFTIRETITFACRLCNKSTKSYENEIQIKTIVDSLGLNHVIDWPISKVSGGERKRTSIAIELISQPVILALDEPTSGLDADNCDKLICTLKKLSRTFISSSCAIRPLIMLTIHSPSYDVFIQFDKVYLLSREGDNLYQGPPRAISTHFQRYNLSGLKGNPAEHVIDIANAKYGSDKFNLIASDVFNNIDTQSSELDTSILSMKKSCPANSLKQITLLISRSLNYYFIKVPQVFVRISEHLMVFFLLTFTMIQTIGEDPLCWTTSDNYFNLSLTTDEYLHRITYKLSFIDKIAQFVPIGSYTGVLLIDATFISSIAAVLLMIYHWPVHQREIRNSWYTLPSYFIAKVSTDLIIRTICIAPAALLFFIRSTVPMDSERLVLFILIILIDASIWENLSATVTLLMGCDKNKLLDTIINVFVYLMADFVFIDIVVPMHNLSRLSRFFKLISPQSNIYSMVIILLFGLNRCSTITGKVNSIDLSLGKPIDSLNNVWHVANISASEPTRMAAVLNLDKRYFQQIYGYIDKWLEPYYSSSDPTQDENSFILSTMGREDNFYRQFFVAITWLIASYVIFWWTLAKFHKKS